MALVCPNCKKEVEGHFAFCPYCGQKLTQAENHKEPKQMVKVTKQLFGFERFDKAKHFKSPDLDEKEVVETLARLTTDSNWTKRLIWLLIAGEGFGHIFSG